MTPPPLLCDICGAANQSQAAYCRSCGHSLQAAKPTIYHSGTGRLLANILLKQRYRIIAPIGKGGMGAVYKAEDIQLGNRKVALKEMSESGLNPQEQKEAADAFRQEAIILARLQHPNLPSIFDHFEENGRWYLVMSFIEGETLADYLDHTQNGKLPLDEVVQIGKQLCTVLSYLHSQQPAIIFRDLKPSNIMRASDGHIYLIDFGIARHFKPGQVKDTAYYGSMGYAPPEQYGKAQTTPRSDIYSLGVVLYQLLSGHNPSTTPFRFPPLRSQAPTVPMELATLITQMIEMDESKRPASMLAVKQALQQIAAQLAGKTPLLSTQPAGGTLPAIIQHSQGKKRTVAIITGMIIVVVMAAVFIPSLLNNHLQSSPRTTLSNPTDAPEPAPTATPTSASTPATTPILPTPPVGSETILYEANWSNGLNGWVGSPDWKAAYGMLVDDGSGPHNWRMSIISAFTPTTSNYAIEAEIQVVTVGGCSSFGLVGRAINGQGEQMGVNFCECHCVGLWDRSDISLYSYDPSTSWHKYRFELKGTSMNFFIDNAKIITAVDNRFTTSGSVGLWCDQMAINVRSYTVYVL